MQKLLSLSLLAILLAGCASSQESSPPPALPQMDIPTAEAPAEAPTETPTEQPNSQQTEQATATAPSIPAIEMPSAEAPAPEATTQEQEAPAANTTQEQHAPAANTTPNITDSQSQQEPAQSQSSSETKDINLQQSLVEWLGEKIVGASHPGSFNLQSGSLTLTDNKITGGSFVIDINSLKSYEGIGSLEKHLLSDDFFDAGQFPTANFQVTNVTYSDDSNFSLTGQLTMKGKTHTETFQATQDKANSTVTASLNLDRTKYDIIFGSGKFFKELADAAIKDIIPLDITIKY